MAIASRICAAAIENCSAPATPNSATSPACSSRSRRADAGVERVGVGRVGHLNRSVANADSQTRSSDARASARSAASITCSGRDPRQAAEIARRADALIARPARQPVDLDRFGRPARDRATAPSAPAASARTAPTIGTSRRRRDVQRPAVAADVERRAVEQRAQLRQRELAARRAPGARSPAPAARAGLGDDAAGRLALRRSGRHDDAACRRVAARGAATSAANDAIGQRRNGLPALTCMTTSAIGRGATPARASRSATAAAAAGSTGISTGMAVRRRAAAMPSGAEQIPLVLDRVPRPQLARPGDAACTSSRGRRRRSRRARGAPLSQRQQRRARAAVEIDREIEARRAAAGGRARGRASPRCRAARRDDHLVEVRVARRRPERPPARRGR